MEGEDLHLHFAPSLKGSMMMERSERQNASQNTRNQEYEHHYQ
jgi:hypothetical protein